MFCITSNLRFFGVTLNTNGDYKKKMNVKIMAPAATAWRSGRQSRKRL